MVNTLWQPPSYLQTVCICSMVQDERVIFTHHP